MGWVVFLFLVFWILLAKRSQAKKEETLPPEEVAAPVFEEPYFVPTPAPKSQPAKQEKTLESDKKKLNRAAELIKASAIINRPYK